MRIYGVEETEYIFFEDKDIGIITYDRKTLKAYLFEFSKEEYIGKDNLKQIAIINNVSSFNIFKELFKKTKDLKLKNRAIGPKNRELELFCGYIDEEPSHFSSSETFLKFFDVDSISKVKLKVVDIFKNEDEIKEEIYLTNNKKDYLYGFWDIIEDKIDSSFIFSHLLQTRVCFEDFGNSALRKGSMFLKLEILK